MSRATTNEPTTPALIPMNAVAAAKALRFPLVSDQGRDPNQPLIAFLNRRTQQAGTLNLRRAWAVRAFIAPCKT
jgi:hypothetical protein